MKRINSQAAILQMSGYFKESLEVYENKSDFLRKSNASA
jgi:tetratricopeptide (TPR) repeat protein